MALRQKPIETPKTDERRIEQIIGKGGSVATQQSRRKKQSNFPLRFMQEDMADRIDAARKKRPIPPSINTWINEAILDRLKAEQ